MSIRREFDYMIIGLGLAGASLALRLHQLGKRILVLDDAAGNTSSRIAAGIFNPVTGRKLTKTWLADQLFPAVHQFYREAEELTGRTFFHSKPIYRPFLTIEEQNEWMGKSSDPGYAMFIREILRGPSLLGVRDPFGGLLLDKCGFLDTNQYVEAVRELMKTEQTYHEEKADMALFVPEKDRIGFGALAAEHAIFSTGIHANPWFGWLPVRPLKGETLTVETPLDPRWVVNRGVYMVPSGREWRVGATYSHNDHKAGVTEESRHALLEGLKDLINLPVGVMGQQWGFRPTTPDRRPLLGRHPQHERMWLFNGMGTKGVSLAPYFSAVLVNAIENGSPINKDVDIHRYKSLYWTSLK